MVDCAQAVQCFSGRAVTVTYDLPLVMLLRAATELCVQTPKLIKRSRDVGIVALSPEGIGF